MSQNDISDDVAAILSATAKWEAINGYELLVVGEAAAKTGGLDSSPLHSRSPDRQVNAAAALALWDDRLQAAHKVFQHDESPDGNLWHAILHRREGDFSNSKYWLARAGRHPAHEALGRLAPAAVNPADRAPIFSPVLQGGWNAPAFVDAVRRISASNDPKSRSIAVRLQRLEWQVLFCHCFHEAG